MSVSHTPTESGGTPYTSWGFGDAHTLPPEQPPDLPIIVSQVPGLQGEAHQTDLPKGRDIAVEATYSGYASFAALLTAFRADQAQTLNGAGSGLGTLRGALSINSVSYGNATFLGAAMTRSPQTDGKNGLWFVDAVLRWRLRS
jgi:hypothetical protein